MISQKLLALLWLRKSLFLIVSFGIFSIISTAILLWPRSYVSTAKVLVDSKPIASQTDRAVPTPVNSNYLATQIEIIESAKVAARVGEILDLSSNKSALERYKNDRLGKETFVQFYTAQLKRGVSAVQSGDASVISISYSANDPSAAAKAANAFVQAYIEISKNLRLDDISNARLVVLDDATSPHSPASPRVMPGFIFATLIAPLIGLLAVLFNEALDRRVRSRVDLEQITGIKVLCVVGMGRPSRSLALLRTMASFFLAAPKQRVY
jgi:uncharacterized protein involved in exopolysaccharide biosynthesis